MTTSPDGDCLVPEFMHATTFIINTKFWVLICIECQYAMAPQSAESHLHCLHCQCHLSLDFHAQLKECFPNLKAEAIHLRKQVPLIFGLAVHDSYLVCNCCLHGYHTQDSFRKHWYTSEDTVPTATHFESSIQTFFSGLHRCYFPITIPTNKVSLNYY